MRNVSTLRVSVTDHCNFRCVYCMPEQGMTWLPKSDLLTYEEFAEVARAAASYGIGEFKLTGGEPLLRKAFVDCVALKPETHNDHGTRQMSQIGG